MNRCLICGIALAENEQNYHSRCMRKLFHSTSAPTFNYTQDELNELAKSIIQQRISVPGVQPKLSLHLEKGNAQKQSRLTLVGLARIFHENAKKHGEHFDAESVTNTTDGNNSLPSEDFVISLCAKGSRDLSGLHEISGFEGNYILKPQTPQWKHLPEAEHFAMLFARMCKISTAEFGLIPLKSGELAYITRRMDRTKDGPLHMEDFCQLTNKLTSQKYNGSMEQVGKALREFSNTPGLDAVRLFELTLFCYLTGNSDMHLKNFSLIRLPDGHHELTPAYDLVPTKIILPADKEELALTMHGKKSNLKQTNFASLANSLGLTEAQYKKTTDNLLHNAEKRLPEALKCSFLPLKMKEQLTDLFHARASLFP